RRHRKRAVAGCLRLREAGRATDGVAEIDVAERADRIAIDRVDAGRSFECSQAEPAARGRFVDHGGLDHTGHDDSGAALVVLFIPRSVLRLCRRSPKPDQHDRRYPLKQTTAAQSLPDSHDRYPDFPIEAALAAGRAERYELAG